MHEVISTSGDAALGGNDFDGLLVDYLLDEAAARGRALRGDQRAMRELM